MDRCDAQCDERAASGEGECEGVHRKNLERGSLMARMQCGLKKVERKGSHKYECVRKKGRKE
jgi:hypothetical protein